MDVGVEGAVVGAGAPAEGEANQSGEERRLYAPGWVAGTVTRKLHGCCIVNHDVFVHKHAYVGDQDAKQWVAGLEEGDVVELMAEMHVQGRNKWRATKVRDPPCGYRRAGSPIPSEFTQPSDCHSNSSASTSNTNNTSQRSGTSVANSHGSRSRRSRKSSAKTYHHHPHLAHPGLPPPHPHMLGMAAFRPSAPPPPYPHAPLPPGVQPQPFPPHGFVLSPPPPMPVPPPPFLVLASPPPHAHAQPPLQPQPPWASALPAALFPPLPRLVSGGGGSGSVCSEVDNSDNHSDCHSVSLSVSSVNTVSEYERGSHLGSDAGEPCWVCEMQLMSHQPHHLPHHHPHHHLLPHALGAGAGAGALEGKTLEQVEEAWECVFRRIVKAFLSSGDVSATESALKRYLHRCSHHPPSHLVDELRRRSAKRAAARAHDDHQGDNKGDDNNGGGNEGQGEGEGEGEGEGRRASAWRQDSESSRQSDEPQADLASLWRTRLVTTAVLCALDSMAQPRSVVAGPREAHHSDACVSLQTLFLRLHRQGELVNSDFRSSWREVVAALARSQAGSSMAHHHASEMLAHAVHFGYMDLDDLTPILSPLRHSGKALMVALLTLKHILKHCEVGQLQRLYQASAFNVVDVTDNLSPADVHAILVDMELAFLSDVHEL